MIGMNTIRMGALLVVLAAGCGDDTGTGSLSGATQVDTSSGDSSDAPTEPGSGSNSSGDGTMGTDDAGTTPTSTSSQVCTQDGECAQGVGGCQMGECQGGSCVLVNLPADTVMPDATGNCQRTVCDGAGALVIQPDDADLAIDDPGNCKATVCQAGDPGFVADDLDLPDDGIECTQDSCDGGTPKFTAKPTNSFCGPQGAQFCHDDTGCRDCKQVSEACEDESMTEANETQIAAHKLGTINDADSSGSFVCAVLTPGDVDWYTFNGHDALFNFVDPTREVITDLNHRICVYITCENGAPSLKCGGDETPDVAPMGQPGCCGTGNVSPSLDCAGTDDSATIWVKVENPDQLACVPYELTYHF